MDESPVARSCQVPSTAPVVSLVGQVPSAGYPLSACRAGHATFAIVVARRLWETEQVKEASGAVGRRVLVIGMAGSGKSTFSRALSAKTGVPVIHLDFHYWKPGWVKPSDDEWRDKQRGLLAGDA